MPTFIWILIGAVFLAVFCRGKGNTSEKEMPHRIDRPHYYDPDDYECSVCGTRFSRDTMVCPNCGAQFGGTVKDETEFEVEEEFEDWMDEEDGL